MIKDVQTRVDSEIHPVALIENAEAIQAAIMHMIDAVLKGTIDNKRANIVLKVLHIAVRIRVTSTSTSAPTTRSAKSPTTPSNT